jgi:hypothetical protein
MRGGKGLVVVVVCALALGSGAAARRPPGSGDARGAQAFLRQHGYLPRDLGRFQAARRVASLAPARTQPGP